MITIDEKIYGRLSALSAAGVLRDFIDRATAGGNGHGRGAAGPARAAPHCRRASQPVEIRIGLGSVRHRQRRAGCRPRSKRRSPRGRRRRRQAGRLQRPLPPRAAGRGGDGGEPALYGNVDADDVRAIVARHVRPRGLLRGVREERATCSARLVDDSAWTPIAARAVDPAPYLGKQVRIVLENCGELDPLSLDEYRARERHSRARGRA